MSTPPPPIHRFPPPIPLNLIKVQDEKSPEQESLNLIDAESLCNQILFSDGPPLEAANNIIYATPEILLSISHYTEKEFIKAFKVPMTACCKADQGRILETLEALYSASLRNSSYNGTVKTLEQNIQKYVTINKTKSLQKLILQGSSLAKEPLNDKDPQKQLRNISEIIGNISEAVDIHYLIDPNFKDRIKKIYAEAVDVWNAPLFPNCRSRFEELCKNLDKNKEIRRQLIQLRSDLIVKSGNIQKQLTTPSFLDPKRESLITYESVLFWEAGMDLLSTAFKATFENDKESLAAAVRKASRIEGFEKYSSANLSNKFEAPPERFIHEVWISFLADKKVVDLDDFMRLVLHRLPEETFQKLQADLKKSDDKKRTLLDSLNEYFKSNITFPSLKNWHGA